MRNFHGVGNVGAVREFTMITGSSAAGPGGAAHTMKILDSARCKLILNAVVHIEVETSRCHISTH